MGPHLRLLAAAAAALAASTGASAAERNFSVTSFDRIRVEGPYRVTLKTNVAPFARASGSAAALDSLSLEVTGRTLVVRRKIVRHGSGGTGPVEIALGTHELTNAWLGGSGGLAISAIRGRTFDLGVGGSGSARVDSIDVDHLRLSVSGTAAVTLAGKAQAATVSVSGPSSLQAGELAIKAATVTASGPATVRLTATDTAKVSAKGLAMVELGGEPACTILPTSSGEVSGCK